MVDYSFYTETFRGSSLTADEWPAFEARATNQLDRYKRVFTVTAPDANAESMAICAMADAMAFFVAVQNGTGGPVSSVSVGSISTSYGSAVNNSVDLSPKGQAAELYRCASMYLDIYRGVS